MISIRHSHCATSRAVEHTAISLSHALKTQPQNITPLSSFADPPLTPPPTDQKSFMQAPRVAL
ncbi:hypothetical protein BKA66DRAFT_478787 [Pyrenochaeta sp. MPI-SDFR-AT-0127]|nr:hypothetical protein BKA66DRAFT_478787 [Pyrenochaeta sp. MPI-SDFR-AT-0127]